MVEAPAVDGVDILGGKKPLPTQGRFLESQAARKVYIGPLGSGKTEVLVWQSILLSHFYAPNFGMVARHTYPELRDTTRKRFMALTPERLIKTASIPEQGGGYIEWNAGGTTIFRHLDTVNPMEFGSLDLGYCGIDEITETRMTSFQMLEGRLGRHWSTLGIAKDRWPYSPMYGTGNPGGMDWVWRLFFKPGHSDLYEGFQPAANENEANLPPNYYRDLAVGKAEWWIKRFIKGDMRALEGLVWPQFDLDLNVVVPFKVPPAWPVRMSFDHGRRNPTAAQWWVVDPWGNGICFRDYEVAGPTPKEHAQAIVRLERGQPCEMRVADPSIFNKTIARGDKWWSVAEEYADCGIEFAPADNAMDASLTRVGQMLWADPDHKYPDWHPKRGERGSPRLFFFNTCERSIESVSSWRFKDWKQDGLGLREEPVGVDDHLPDCLRYWATSFPEAPKEQRDASPKPWTEVRQSRLAAHLQLARKVAAQEGRGDDENDYV